MLLLSDSSKSVFNFISAELGVWYLCPSMCLYIISQICLQLFVQTRIRMITLNQRVVFLSKVNVMLHLTKYKPTQSLKKITKKNNNVEPLNDIS